MIQVENITRKYGYFTAVDDVSFTIRKGEIVGLLGHNGAGETTIMKMLTGYLEPTSGNITIDGLPIRENRSLIQKMIGYLPENCPIYPEMSILCYLDYSASLHGVSERDRAVLISEAVSRTALKEKATELIPTLSRGYRQRVGVAQAILHKPAILILDEPTNGLDPTQIQHRYTEQKLMEAALFSLSSISPEELRIGGSHTQYALVEGLSCVSGIAARTGSTGGNFR